MGNIKNEVRQFLLDNYMMGGSEDDIGDDVSFLDLGIIDSTGVLELVSHLEQTYEVQVGDHEMIPENLDSLNKIQSFLAEKRKASD